MNIALWILAGILAALFLASGAAKIVQPRRTLLAHGYAWAEDFSPAQVKVIGGLETIGAAGLVLPAALGITEVLTPTAAVGLTLLMLAAALVHVRRNEAQHLAGPLVLAALTALIAVLRFGPYGF